MRFLLPIGAVLLVVATACCHPRKAPTEDVEVEPTTAATRTAEVVKSLGSHRPVSAEPPDSSTDDDEVEPMPYEVALWRWEDQVERGREDRSLESEWAGTAAKTARIRHEHRDRFLGEDPPGRIFLVTYRQ